MKVYHRLNRLSSSCCNSSHIMGISRIIFFTFFHIFLNFLRFLWATWAIQFGYGSSVELFSKSFEKCLNVKAHYVC